MAKLLHRSCFMIVNIRKSVSETERREHTMDKIYFTIAGAKYRYGTDFMKKGMKVKLVKEPDNEHDPEAIRVEMKGMGQVGYVANSTYTVKGESMSAGRIYDKIGKKAKGRILYLIGDSAICELSADSIRK